MYQRFYHIDLSQNHAVEFEIEIANLNVVPIRIMAGNAENLPRVFQINSNNQNSDCQYNIENNQGINQHCWQWDNHHQYGQ